MRNLVAIFLLTLQLILITLKLIGVFDWSWCGVLSIITGYFLTLFILLIAHEIMELLEKRFSK